VLLGELLDGIEKFLQRFDRSLAEISASLGGPRRE
jgi:hypothetical protein